MKVPIRAIVFAHLAERLLAGREPVAANAIVSTQNEIAWRNQE
jgi:hypothetical protein